MAIRLRDGQELAFIHNSKAFLFRLPLVGYTHASRAALGTRCHSGVEGNDNANSGKPSDPELFLGLSLAETNGEIACRCRTEQLRKWRGVNTCRQNKLFIWGPKPAVARGLLCLNKPQLKPITGVLTGHCTNGCTNTFSALIRSTVQHAFLVVSRKKLPPTLFATVSLLDS